jgi:MFS family permease
MVLEGVVNGAWQLNEIVARKSMGASTLWVTLIVMSPSVALLLSALWGPYIEGRRKAPFFLLAGVVGRLVLLAVAGVREPALFALVLAVSALSYSILFPAQNAIYQSNYAPGERGRLFGRAYSAYAVASIVTALALGWLYDRNAGGYRWAYPTVGLAGFWACWEFYRLRERRVRKSAPTPPQNPLLGVWRLLAADRDFALYEAGFFCYGLGFMIMVTLLPLYLVDILRASYWQASWMKVVLYLGVQALFSTVAGRYMDKSHPASLARLSFLGLALFPLLLGVSHTVWGGYGAFLWFGLCMAGVSIAWYLGPLAFAGERDSSVFMTAHVALTGVRALIGHPIGALLYVWTGRFTVPFATASGCFLAGAACMTVLARRSRLQRC